MGTGETGNGAVVLRGALNLAELIQRGAIELTDLVVADSAALLAVQLEVLEQLTTASSPAARERILGYPVEDGQGDVDDFVERRLVTEYLIATGVDALLVPLTKDGPVYSHVARDASLVAIAGDIAPAAVLQCLTACPRLLLYGLDGEGLEVRGRLLRRVVPVTDPIWPRQTGQNGARSASSEQDALRSLIEDLQRGRPAATRATAGPTPAGKRRAVVAERRLARRRRLNQRD